MPITARKKDQPNSECQKLITIKLTPFNFLLAIFMPAFAQLYTSIMQMPSTMLPDSSSAFFSYFITVMYMTNARQMAIATNSIL
jgi:hypothetical protein